MQLFDAMGKPIKMEADDIEHHGVIGMKWGQRRYQNPDGSLTPLGKRRLEAKQRRTVQKEQKAEVKRIKKAYKKAEKEQKKADELAEKKARLLLKGTREEVYKNRDLFTKQELSEYLQRQQQIEAVSKGTGTEKMIKAKEFVDKMALGVSIGSTALNTWNTAATLVNNLAGKEKLPEFNLAKKTEKAKKEAEELKKRTEEATKKARQTLLQNMTPEQIARNYHNMTSEEIKDIANRQMNIGRIDKYLNEVYRPAQDELRARRYESGIPSVTQINSSKNFVNTVANTDMTYSKIISSDTTSYGKNMVNDLINSPIGDVSSKWSPAPNATYKVTPDSVVTSTGYNKANSLINDTYIPKTYSQPTKSDMDDLLGSLGDNTLRTYLSEIEKRNKKKK